MIHSVGVNKNSMEILRYKRESVLFCFSNLSNETVKKAYQAFSSLVYCNYSSFQFNLEIVFFFCLFVLFTLLNTVTHFCEIWNSEF